MHIFQPKHSKLKPEEVSQLLNKFNISRSQLPRIKKGDAALPLDVEAGDVIKVERKSERGKEEYYRVVVP